MTCNYLHKILPALQSRCVPVDFKIAANEKPKLATKFLKRVKEILELEKIGYDEQVLMQVISKWFPDWRRIMNELQRYGATGNIDTGILAVFQETSLRELLDSIKEQDFNKMRRWVGENSAMDIGEFYLRLYETLPPMLSKGGKPHAVVVLAQYQYEAAFSTNHEINMMACLSMLAGRLQGEWK